MSWLLSAVAWAVAMLFFTPLFIAGVGIGLLWCIAVLIIWILTGRRP